MENEPYTDYARHILERFLEKTGVKGNSGNPAQRYLWTDALAVQALFGLSMIFKKPVLKEYALDLIDLVHLHLGSYHPGDERSGRISGLSGAEAELHPTLAGLRIGKNLPERKKDQQYNPRLEWERDGQYFHYLTRWISALLEAERQTRKSKYADWAFELMWACRKFIQRDQSEIHMNWKMNTDLSHPLVPSTGAHDPLEGLICIKGLAIRFPKKASELFSLTRDFETLCSGQVWSTSDPLGIGGLLLNTVHASQVIAHGGQFIPEARPENLFRQSLESLQKFSESFSSNQPAAQRLAFREGGLSLGLRAVYGHKNDLCDLKLPFEHLYPFLSLAQEIETFWRSTTNQECPSWKAHENINSVTLASSIIAQHESKVF